MSRILLVEDEPSIAAGVRDDLELEGYSVDVVTDGVSGGIRGVQGQYDLILLDVMLPKKDGFTVCREIRAAGVHTPVLMLTARGQEADKVLGLELGADDYITKPFSLRELTARVRVALRRTVHVDDRPAAGSYRDAHIVADFDAVAVSVDGESIRLTRREFELLQFLVQNKNRVISRDRLLERVWGYDRSIETRSVDVHVGRLRTKLRVAGRQIETVVGLGYRFVEEQIAQAQKS